MLNDWSEEKGSQSSLYNTTIWAGEGEAAGESAGEVEGSQSGMYNIITIWASENEAAGDSADDVGILFASGSQLRLTMNGDRVHWPKLDSLEKMDNFFKNGYNYLESLLHTRIREAGRPLLLL